MDALAIIVLAAGKGKRMGGDLPKVAIRTDEKPLLEHVLASAGALKPSKVIVVTGHRAEQVQQVVRAGAGYDQRCIEFIDQPEQLGTGHAVQCAEPALKDFVGTVLILCGDVPLIETSTLERLLAMHHDQQATISVLSFLAQNPGSYGRVMRDQSGAVSKIVEARDCTPSERAVRECNSGIYAVDSAFLFPAVKSLKAENAQKELYLTDIVATAVSEGQRVVAELLFDEREVMGVNTPAELAQVNRILLARRIEQLLQQGVQIDDLHSLWIDPSVRVGRGTRIGPNVQLRGGTVIGEQVQIEGSALLIDTEVADGATLKFGVRCERAVIGCEASVGPFAHLRPGAALAEEVKVGNFVEVKNAQLAKGAKASHLTYLGDATVGADANIGAGTITCNYDGFFKHRTIIGAGAFIGSNTSLVAPVSIGDGALVGAGSTISRNVADDALAVTRAPQIEKAGWAAKNRARLSAKKAEQGAKKKVVVEE